MVYLDIMAVRNDVQSLNEVFHLFNGGFRGAIDGMECLHGD